uniref:Uncharacterized protein n=1 Tax=Schizaphis graminum TaxID=13262 RepID=A0A2S2P918_SCHGA
MRLTPEKSECVVLTKKYIYRDPVLHIDGCPVALKRAVRYLGVQLDTRLSFGVHVESVTTGARKAASALGRLMPNVGGPAQCKRSLLMSVVHSRLLYDAEVWADEVQHVAKYRNLMLQGQKYAALRVARCYRTVSDIAALVLAGMPPVTLQAIVRKRATALRREGAVLTAYVIHNLHSSAQNRAFKTSARELYAHSNVEELVDGDFASLQAEEDSYAGKYSGFTLSCIDGLLLGVYDYTPMGGSSYLPLPESILSRNAVINPQNIDRQCFKWAILAKHVPNDRARASRRELFEGRTQI